MTSSLDLLIGFCNYTAIGSCLILKLPQVLTLLRTGNANGISLNGVLVEYIAHLIVFSYNWIKGYELASYFDYFFLLIQDFILIFVVFQTLNILNLFRVGSIGLLLALFYGFARGYPHPAILTYLINVVIPLGAFSKILYIKEIWKTKDSSNVSVFTWVLCTYSCITRIITNGLKGDAPLLVHSIVGTILCTAMVISALRFKTVPAIKRLPKGPEFKKMK